MSQKLKALLLRRSELQMQSQRVRLEFSKHFEPWEKPLSWADKGIDAFHFIKDNPLLWTSVFAALAHYKPKLASKLLALGWGALKVIKGVRKSIF
jgi:hypothetical protein